MTRPFLLSLFVFCSSFFANAEIRIDITSDSLKGKIWTMTAARIRVDRGLSKKSPIWKTDSEFTIWRKKSGSNDELDIIGLWTAVRIRNSGKNGRVPATPLQLTEAIIAEIQESSLQNKSVLKRVKSAVLKKQLDSLLQASSKKEKKSSIQEVVQNDVQGSAKSNTGAIGVDEDLDPNQGQQVQQERGFIAKQPLLIPGFVACLSFLLGAIAAAVYRHINLKHAQFTRSGISTNSGDYIPKSKYEKLKKEKNELLAKVATLERTISIREEEGRVGVKSAEKERDIDFESSIVPGRSDSFIQHHENTTALPISVSSIPPTQSRYAPASEGAFVEDRKVVERAMDKLPLMLSLNSNNPDRATFALNPGVNQEWLIRVGLEQLREYFDFTIPITKPVTVAAAGSGQLTRQGEGWQVTTRAKLTIR